MFSPKQNKMNPAKKVAAVLMAIATATLTAMPAQAQCEPKESDFPKFINLLPNVPATAKIETQDFVAVFGDAASVNALGLRRLTNRRGCFEATFATPGAVQCGPATLEYGTKVKFTLVGCAGGVEMKNVKGLRAREGMLNPVITDIQVSIEDPIVKQWTVHVTAKEMFISATRDVVIADDAA